APSEAIDLTHLRRFNELVLRSMPVGLVVIDRGYRMITSNPAVRRLLQIHDRAGEPDFLHAVRGIPYNDVRNAIDAAFRDGWPASAKSGSSSSPSAACPPRTPPATTRR